MERIIWTHLSPEPFYVFDDAHIVHFWDDGVGIHRTQEWYRDADTWLSPFGGPHLYLKALPLSFYKSIVLGDRLPISLTLEGGNLGTVNLTAESTSPKRRITRQETRLALADGHLSMWIEAQAADQDPERRQFEFAFPLDLVPEVLDLTDGERRRFERRRRD